MSNKNTYNYITNKVVGIKSFKPVLPITYTKVVFTGILYFKNIGCKVKKTYL